MSTQSKALHTAAFAYHFYTCCSRQLNAGTDTPLTFDTLGEDGRQEVDGDLSLAHLEEQQEDGSAIVEMSKEKMLSSWAKVQQYLEGIEEDNVDFGNIRRGASCY